MLPEQDVGTGTVTKKEESEYTWLGMLERVLHVMLLHTKRVVN